MKDALIIGAVLLALGLSGYAAYQKSPLGAAAFPPASDFATSTGWADDGSVVRLANSNDSVGIGTTSPSEKLGIAASVIIEESSATSTLIIGGESGRGGCIQLEATDGTVVRIYATTTPTVPSTADVTRGLVIEAGACQ